MLGIASDADQSVSPTGGDLDNVISITASGSQSENANYTQTTSPNEDAIVSTFDRTMKNKEIPSQKRNLRKRPSTSQTVKLSKRPKVISLRNR